MVSSGALVSQTSDTVTVNDTYDTTLINSLTVNVSGSSDPHHLSTGSELFISKSGVNWRNNQVELSQNDGNRMSVVALSGTAQIPYYNSATLSGRYLIPIPNGATKVTFTIDKNCQYNIKEFIETGGTITSCIETINWTDITANTGLDTVLSVGTNYIGISLRVNSSSPSFTVSTQPLKALVDFS